MSTIIDTVQLQDIDDSIIDLFEVTINGVTLYLYSGLDSSNEAVHFPEPEAPYTAKEYLALPISIKGIEIASDGAQVRPELSVANIVSLARTITAEETTLQEELEALGIVDNEDLLGSKVKRRRTLGKNLVTAGSSGTPPIEFPPHSYVIDRVSKESGSIITFELASPYDIEGVQLPSRVVVGKYCPWRYQGATDSANPQGACTWPQDSKALFFDIFDNEITGYTTYSSITTYVVDDKVIFSNNIYQAIRGSLSKQPDISPAFWKRIDLCGKTVNSCKVRFQETGSGLDSSIPLPFGGFPGSRKFK